MIVVMVMVESRDRWKNVSGIDCTAADRRRKYVPNHTSPHLLIYPSPSSTYISGIWEIGGSRLWKRNLRPLKWAGS